MGNKSKSKTPFSGKTADHKPSEDLEAIKTSVFVSSALKEVDKTITPIKDEVSIPISNNRTSHSSIEVKDLETLQSEVMKEEQETVDPVSNIVKEIGEQLPKFPVDILKYLGDKIKEKFNKSGTRTLLTTTLGISLASSLFNLLKDIYVACMATTPGAMTVCILGIVTSLASMAAQIATICHIYKADFDLSASMECIQNSIAPHLNGVEPHADITNLQRFKAWIPRIITFLTTAVAAGLSFLPKGSAIGTLISNYGNSKKIGEDVSGVMSEFLSDVVGITLEGDPAYVTALVKLNSEGVELLTTPMHQFHVNTKLRARLISYPQRVDESTLHRTNNDTFKTLRMTLQSLQSTRNHVVQRIQELNDSSQRTLRQEPVGIFLAGMGGIGKSYFAKEIAKALADECGYEQDVYCIDKSDDNFYEPYKGEATGIANEFMSRRAENEPLLRDINKICSEDYFNFEGAALHTKNQPCHLKTVIITSNVKNPDMTRVQEPTVTAAMWSRFRRFEVIDKRFQNADEARINPNGLERSSEHLIFKEFVTDTSRNITEIKTWTSNEIIRYVVSQCRKKEKVFLERMLKDNPYNFDDTGIKDLKSRIAILDGLVPCAKDGRVFTVRLEGPPGTGKTHFMEKRLIPSILSTFPQLSLHRWSTANPVPTDNKFYLVVVDDTLEDSEKEYFEMLKTLSNRSMVLIGTNTVLKPRRDWLSATLGRVPVIGGPFDWAPAIDVTPIPGVPSGFWRRIGIADRIRVGDSVFEPYSSDVCHYRFEQGFIILRDGKQLALETAEEEITEKYIAYLQEAGDFIWSERRLNIVDPTVKIIARSYKDMVEVLSGSTGMFSLLQCFKKSGTDNPDPRMQIFLDAAFMKLVFNRAGVEEWRVPDRPINGATRLHVAEKISAFLRKFKPDATVVVTITNPGLDDEGASDEPHLYELKGSMGYYTQASLESPTPQLTYNQFGVRIHSTNETVSYEECAMIEKEHALPNHYKPTTLRVLKQSNLSHPHIDHARMNYARRINFAEEMQSARVLSFFKHPATIACLSILGLLSTAGTIYGIYKACSSLCSEKVEGMIPCDDTADSRDGQARRAAAQALRKGRVAANKPKWQEMTKEESLVVDRAIEDNWLAGIPVSQYVPYSEEIKKLSPEAQKHIAEMQRRINLVPSTVTPDMEIKAHYDPRLATMMEKVVRNLVTIKGHGSNYGLVFEGDILVTTAHTVAGLSDVRIVSKEFTGTARVVRVSIPRDIAILQLVSTDNGKRAPQFPSLRKHFLANIAHLDRLAWFVKPFTRNTVFVCGKMVTTPSYKCFSSSLSETFNPSEWIITFFQHHMTWSPTLFQRGECGLPLFVEVNGEYKICGIFNAANQMQHVTFASISASDFNNTQGIIPMSRKVCETVEYKSVQAGVPYFTANEFVIECLDSISYGNVTHENAGYPEPIGHCRKLRSHSYPKHKTRPLAPHNASAPGGLENTQRLSCINEALSPDIDIPRRSRFENGVRVSHSKEPLFLQIQKYSKARGFSADMQVFGRAIKEVIHSYRLRTGITPSNPLRLLTTKECLNGIRNGALGGFSRDTGAGPTLKAKFNIVEKNDIFHRVVDDPPVFVLSENAGGTWVRNEVAEKLNSIMNGVPVLFLTKACKKVEKIDRESWEIAKVRLFTECDFADNLLLKMLFGDLQNRLAQAPGTPLLLNLNPYTMPAQVADIMGHDLTNMVGTDISSMDKHFPHQMIAAFVQICGALYNWPTPVQRAIACSLMFPLQNFEGDVFTSPCGNLSGWFVTALINCVAQELMIAYDRIKNIGDSPLPFDILKTNAEPYAILGDDKVQKLTPARAAAQEKSYLECGFIMQAGSKLQGHEERFCSRVIYKEGAVYFGALKLSAISGLIYFASSSELEAILPNFALALFEAALHKDPSIYDKALISIKWVADYNNLPLEDLASRDRYREIYEQYCTGLSTVLKFCGHRPDILSILEHCKMGDNARMALNQYAQQTKQAPPSFSTNMTGPAHSPTWTVDLSFMGKTYNGTGESKASASEKAAQLALQEVSVTPRMDSEDTVLTVTKEFVSEILQNPKGYMVKTYRIDNTLRVLVSTLLRMTLTAAKRAANNFGFEVLLDVLVEEHLKHVQRIGGRVCVWHASHLDLQLKDHMEGMTRYKVDEKGNKYVLSAVMQRYTYSQVIGALESAGCIGMAGTHTIEYPGLEGPCMGPDTPIQPENIQQANMNTGAMTIPQLSNPQPTGQAPSLAPPAEKIVSALEAISTETMNPLGPPNMLAVGAVVFDIKDLVYSQFLDCDQQFVITDDTPPGSVLLQIPYDPLGEWVNPYIRQYVGQHERYTGSLMFRMTIVGNPTFSGLIGVAWQPRRVASSVVNVSEMQKYSYYGVTVELPSNKVICLNDARQDLFWRSTLDSSDVDNRPHLVLFTMMSLVSPLREGIQTRIRIASKLSNGGLEDGIGRNAFQASLPTVSVLPTASNRSVSQSTRLADLVPEFSGKQAYLCTDGIAYSGRGDSLQQELRTYGGSNDQSKMYVFNTAGAQYDIGPGNTNAWNINSYHQTFNICGLIQNGVEQGDTTVKSQTCYAIYETNNLPVTLFESIRNRIFGDALAVGTVYNQVERYITSLEDPSTYADLGLLGIYYSPAIPFNEEFGVPNTLIQNISWPISSAPGSTTRMGFLKISGTNGDCYGMKLVFREGIMVLYIVGSTTNVDAGSERTRGPNAISINPVANPNGHTCANNPLWQIATPMPQKVNFPPWTVEAQATSVPATLLPAGWAKISITPVVPSVVIPTIFTPTLLSSGSLEKALARRAQGLSTSQCIAFDIVDPVSNRRVCSARYLQETGDIVCSVPSTVQNNIYAAYPSDISEAILSNFGIIERSNAFVITDTTTWLTRKTASVLGHFGAKSVSIKERTNILDEYFGKFQKAQTEPHASMAAMAALSIGGGAMSGIGSGLSSIAERRHQTTMQENQFKHQTGLVDQMHANNLDRDSQSHSFNLERDSQNHMFELERMMENFGYTNQLQAQQFQHNHDMSNQNFQQAQAMAYASSPGRVLMGGSTRASSFI